MAAYGFGFGTGAVHRRRAATAAPTPTPTPSIPAAADLALWLRPEDLALGDGAAVASWTDSIAGATAAQATAANRPTYRAAVSGSGGKPGLQFDQTHWLNFGRPAALMNALAHYNDTTGATLFFVLNVGPNPATSGGFRTFWSPSNINDNGSYIASSTFVGPRANRREKAGGGFRVIVVRRDSIVSNQADQATFFDNMGGIQSGSLAPHASSDYMIGASGNGTAQFGFVGHIHDIGCYNRALSNAEVCRLVKYFHDKYGQPYPWAGLGHFDMFDGDSQTWGVGGSLVGNRDVVQQGWPNVLMDAKGRSYDGWLNLAIGNRTSLQMTNAVAMNYAGLRQELGIPIILHCFEFYNLYDANATQMKAYLAAVKAADPGIVIACGTSIDNGKVTPDTHMTFRAPFNAALATSPNHDVFVPLHTDPTVGVEGACPDEPGPYTPNFNDAIHTTNAGHAAIAAFWAPYYDLAVARL